MLEILRVVCLNLSHVEKERFYVVLEETGSLELTAAK